jgi:hypothetical protein
MEDIMNKFVSLAVVSALALGVAQADDHTSYFAVGHKMMTLDFGAEDFDATGTQLTLGTRINDNMLIELNLATLADIDTNIGDFEATSTDLSLLYYPMNSGFFGRLGYSKSELEFGALIDEDEGSEILGIGYDIMMGESGAIRIEYTAAEYDDTDVDGFTISTGVRF